MNKRTEAAIRRKVDITWRKHPEWKSSSLGRWDSLGLPIVYHDPLPVRLQEALILALVMMNYLGVFQGTYLWRSKRIDIPWINECLRKGH